MRHLFIVNPVAGHGKAGSLKESIYSAAAKLGIKAEIYETKGLGDGEDYVRQAIEEAERRACQAGGDAAKGPGAPSGKENKEALLRIYSCGGDGTLNEIVNSAVGKDHVEVACLPMGTGNDFVRNFEGDFLDVENQMRGEAILCDAISYTGMEGIRYCANMCNIGFDCNVVDHAHRLKTKPLIRGPLAYFLGALMELVKKQGTDLIIEMNGDTPKKRQILLVAIANGSFCGGGFNGVPKAQIQDGLMDVSIIKNMSRTRFLRLLPLYKKGTHLGHPKVGDLVEYCQCKKLTITSSGDIFRLAVDGEICEATELHMTLVPEAFRFVLPAKA